MNVDALAERVLTGTSLADKLLEWPEVGPIGEGRAVPDVPGRPASLALPRNRRSGASLKGVRLETEAGRARVLHELANHELQAMELLALALLRWPDAPKAFRRGLIATLRDEQRHFRMYVNRLERCGGTLGEQPVSRYFWDTLHGVESPQAFVAGLSLCFEQANLDFCQHWGRRFAEAGDAETSSVLRAVYEDEIRHVAHGLTWFGRWSDGERVQAWVEALPAPLTPSRGRGPEFDTDGRARAGFTAAEIERLKVVGGSRGRPGRVVWFDAGLEDLLAEGSRSRMARAVNADLATLPMFLVRAEDVVVAPSPAPAFLARLADAGFDVPRFAERLDAVQPQPVTALEPWGPAPRPLYTGDIEVLKPGAPWQASWRALSSKSVTLERSERFADDPRVVSDLGRVWTAPGDPGEAPWVIKAPFSASGSRRIRGQGPLSAAQVAWVERQLERFGSVVWQPWHTRVADVSIHVTVADSVRIDGITRFTTGPGGVFTGTLLNAWVHGLPSEVQRAIHGGGVASAAIQPLLEDAGRSAGAWARSLGFRGPLSIDAMIVREGGEIRVHPWLETNARRTLGRVGLALRTGLHGGARGTWHVERLTEARRTALLDAAPPETRQGRLYRGVLPTTDPRHASALLTWIDADPVRSDQRKR